MLHNLINMIKEDRPDDPLPENYVKGFLNASDAVAEYDRESLYEGYAHVSSLAKGFCARRYAIMHKDNVASMNSLTGGHKVTFALGRAAEKHVREAFFKQYGKHKVYAKWQRPDGSFYEGFCQATYQEEHVFHEVDIQDEEFHIKGHPDMIFTYNSLLRVVEIKSMNKEDWDALEEPLIEHIIQAAIYPRLLKKQGLDVSDEVIFIYVRKDFIFGSPYKEFHIKTKDYDNILSKVFEDAAELKKYWVEGELPHKICASTKSSYAKKCSVSGRCFTTYSE